MNAIHSSDPRAHDASKEPLVAIRRELTEDGVCTLTFDSPDSESNTFDAGAFHEFEAHLDFVANDSGVTALILFSAKKEEFHSGLVPEAFEDLAAKKDNLLHLIQLGQSVVAKLSALPIPTVAAIHGRCLGAGLEIALACDWRVASSANVTKFSLDDVKRGLVPVLGACTQLPQLAGLIPAFDFVEQGQPLGGQRSKRLRLIDEVTAPDSLMEASEWLAERGKRKSSRLRNATNFVSSFCLKSYRAKQLRKRSAGHELALWHTWDLMSKHFAQSLHQSYDSANRALALLLDSPETFERLRYFQLKERTQRSAFLDSVPTKPIRNATVLGSGHLAVRLAHALAKSGVRVSLIDPDKKALKRAEGNISRLIREEVEKEALTPQEADALNERISTSGEPFRRETLDLTIEAMSHTKELKRQFLQELGNRCSANTLVAITTPTLLPSDLHNSIPYPENLLALHFSGSVLNTDLVEVVTTPQTSAAAYHRAMALLEQMGQTPLMAPATPGYLVLRLLVPYLESACVFYGRRVDPLLIDKAMTNFGMKLGPLRYMDEVGLDRVAGVMKALANSEAGYDSVPEVLEAMVTKGMTGRHSPKGGFYEYHDDRTKINQEALALRSSKHQSVPVDTEQIQARLELCLTREVRDCLAKGIAKDADQMDLALILSAGWPEFRSSPSLQF